MKQIRTRNGVRIHDSSGLREDRQGDPLVLDSSEFGKSDLTTPTQSSEFRTRVLQNFQLETSRPSRKNPSRVQLEFSDRFLLDESDQQEVEENRDGRNRDDGRNLKFKCFVFVYFIVDKNKNTKYILSNFLR